MKTILLHFLLLGIAVIQAQENTPNIILMIGDGMGLTQISAGMYANNNKTVLEEFPVVGLSKTYSADQLITDSAASGTAMASGVKTFNGVLGIDSKNIPQKSILEICIEHGYSTALLATSSIVHATPAAFYANVTSRKLYEDIAVQLSEHEVDFFVGGGSKFFSNREDKRNLKNEMEDYEFVKSIKEFEKSTSPKIGFLTYEGEPPSLLDKRIPSLAEVTQITLKKIQALDKPFFMMIEGSQIDWGGHANEIDYVVSEFKEFDSTIQKVLEFAKAEGNTLVIVTADHETGGLTLSGGDFEKGKVKGSFNTEGHSATMVPVFSYGPNSTSFSGIYENTALFEKMLKTVKGD
jgi:alkaline phosphatase